MASFMSNYSTCLPCSLLRRFMYEIVRNKHLINDGHYYKHMAFGIQKTFQPPETCERASVLQCS